MFTSISIYLLMTLLLFWAYCGYLILLHLMSLFGHTDTNSKELIEWPEISILIPCYNEEQFINEKLNNILQIDYPKGKLDFIFLDGCSTDQTIAHLNQAIGNYENIRVIQTNCKGKINQINRS